MKYRYESNNSGGSWWLTTEDWKNLEKAGWVVDWLDKPFLNAAAREATYECLSLEEAQESFRKVTGQSPFEEGCPCCGQPHQFYEV